MDSLLLIKSLISKKANSCPDGKKQLSLIDTTDINGALPSVCRMTILHAHHTPASKLEQDSNKR